jgi:hypothetical protein
MPKSSKKKPKRTNPLVPATPLPTRPTTHPLLEGPSHQDSADARALVVRQELNAYGSNLPPCSPAQRKEWIRRAVEDLQTWAVLYAHWLATSQDNALRAALEMLFHSKPGCSPPTPRSNWVGWLIDIIDDSQHHLPPFLHNAVASRRRARKKRHTQKQNVGSHLAVFKTPLQYAKFHSLIFHFYVKRRPSGCEYPPAEKWIAETEAAYRVCVPFFRNQNLHDKRRKGGKKATVHRLKDKELDLIVPEDLSVVLYDADTNKPFASVVRNFSNSKPTLAWMRRVVDKAARSRRTARVSSHLPSVLFLH